MIGYLVRTIRCQFCSPGVTAVCKQSLARDRALAYCHERPAMERLHIKENSLDTTAKADLDSGTITRTVVVRASQRHTWDTLTDPSTYETWWEHPTTFSDGMAEGASGTLEWIGHGLFPLRIQRFEPPTHFEFLWGDLGHTEPDDNASLVQFSLAADGPDRTLVTVVESGFTHLPAAERRAAMEDNVHGWTRVLDSFVEYVGARA